MAKTYSESETIEAIAASLIPMYHPELANARIKCLFMDQTPKKNGREIPGKAQKVSGKWEHLTELDFVLEIAEPVWNDMTNDQRTALVDHLLECCTGEEDEQSGEMKWSIRSPDVQEFSTILERHGNWNETLGGFLQVAQSIELDGIIEDETESDAETELDLNDESIDHTEG